MYNHLKANGIDFEYETHVIKYKSPVRGGVCTACGSRKCAKDRSYTPDFIVTRTDGTIVYLETKGRFPSTDRSKMRDVIKHNPALDIRMVFERSSKKRMLDQAAWCEKNGFYYHFGPEVPSEWII